MRIDGQDAIDRPAMAATAGVAAITVDHWVKNRPVAEPPGGAPVPFPDRLARIRNKDWFDAAAFHSWLAAWEAAHAPRQIHDHGDPAELLNADQVATLLGIDLGTLHRYLGMPTLGFPDADETEPLGGGKTRRRWKRGRIIHWNNRQRRGRGGRRPLPAEQRRTGKPPPTYRDDPRLAALLKLLETHPGQLTIAQAAHELDLPEHTTRRLLEAARQARPELVKPKRRSPSAPWGPVHDQRPR